MDVAAHDADWCTHTEAPPCVLLLSSSFPLLSRSLFLFLRWVSTAIIVRRSCSIRVQEYRLQDQPAATAVIVNFVLCTSHAPSGRQHSAHPHA